MSALPRPALFLVIAGLAACAAAGWAGNKAQVGGAAPGFQVSAYPDGRPVTLDALHGTPAILEFWSTQCGRCRAVIPHLADLRARHAPEDLAILAVTEESAEQIREFVAGAGINYEVGLDPGYKAHGEYGVKDYPLGFVLDPEGRIAFEGAPGTPAFDAAVEAVVAEVAARRPFGRYYAALVERGEGQDSVLLEATLTAGPKAPRRSLSIDVMGAHYEAQTAGGAVRRADLPLTDAERADLMAALRGADLARQPRGYGAVKPGSALAEITVLFGADAVKTVVLAPAAGAYRNKGAGVPPAVAALWKRLEPLLQRGEARAR